MFLASSSSPPPLPAFLPPFALPPGVCVLSVFFSVFHVRSNQLKHTPLSPAAAAIALRRCSFAVGDRPNRTLAIPKQLARAGSESQQANPEEPAAPTELSLPQLCLAVSAKELIAGMSGKGRGARADGAGNADGGGGGGAGGPSAADEEQGKGPGGLFRERQPLAFFAVDCRPKDQVRSVRSEGRGTVILSREGGFRGSRFATFSSY